MPNIKDIDGVVSYDELIIEDKTMSNQIKGLGSIFNRFNNMVELKDESQFMTYDISKRQIVLKFKTINDLINVNGIHPIKITIKDSKND